MVCISGPAIVDDTVLNLDAANNRSYPGSDTTWYNLSNSTINGTLLNGVGYTADNNGAMTFDGTNDVVSVTIAKAASCTFEFWAYLNSGTTNCMLFNAGNVSNGPDLFFAGGKICWNTWDSSNNPFANIPSSVYNSYRHYVVVNDSSSNTKLYYDGQLLGSANYRSAASTSTFVIGKAGSAGGDSGYPWRGKIAKAKIYNRILSAAEIKQNFEATRGRYGI